MDGQPVHLRSSILVDVQMGEQSNPTFFDHGEGLGDDDGAPSQSRCPMPLLSVVALQGDSLALAESIRSSGDLDSLNSEAG